jgi:diacylglycerol kinase (ATP)
MTEIQRVQVIINPGSGQPMPVLHTLNQVFNEFGYDWDIALTKKAGDGHRLAQEAAAAGYDVVAAYGGDGTVAEVASGLIGTSVPLAILPGGTANVMSVELGIPNDLDGASRLFCGDACQARWIDMGEINGRPFLLRAGIGFEAAMVQEADREAKNGMGIMAYLFSALSNLRQPQEALYHITIDGESIESKGLTCIIANSMNLGRPGLSLIQGVDVSDGILDVIVVRQADLRSLLAVTANVAGLANLRPVKEQDRRQEIIEETDKPLQHWQAREIMVESTPLQPVQSDGEMVGETPVHCRVLPRAVQILVPTEL